MISFFFKNKLEELRDRLAEACANEASSRMELLSLSDKVHDLWMEVDKLNKKIASMSGPLGNLGAGIKTVEHDVYKIVLSEMPTRAWNAREVITKNLEELCTTSRDAYISLKGIGETTMNEVDELLSRWGLSVGMSKDRYHQQLIKIANKLDGSC